MFSIALPIDIFRYNYVYFVVDCRLRGLEFDSLVGLLLGFSCKKFLRKARSMEYCGA